MVRIAVQARSGAARFSVAVQAASVDRALEIVKGQETGRDCEVTSPLDPETSLVAESSATSEPAEWKRTAA
jgi:hypothetical protein